MSRRLLRFDGALPLRRLAGIRFQAPAMSLSLLGFSGWRWSKLFSLACLAGAISLLVWLHMDATWFVYRENVSVTGARLLNPDDLFGQMDVDGWNLFWLQKEEVRGKLLAQPWVTNAEVSVELPTQVAVKIVESAPLAVWVTEAGSYWVAASGATLPMAEGQNSALPRIIDPQQYARSFSDQPGTANEATVQTGVIESALALIRLTPGLSEVRYSPEIGLNFGLPDNGPWVYWGDGHAVEQKLKNIALGRKLIASGDVRGAVIDVRYPEKPLIR